MEAQLSPQAPMALPGLPAGKMPRAHQQRVLLCLSIPTAALAFALISGADRPDLYAGRHRVDVRDYPVNSSQIRDRSKAKIRAAS